MNTIITQAVEKLKRKIETFLEGEEKSISEAEKYLTGEIAGTVTTILSAYYVQIDENLRKDKKKRKEEGLVIERLGDKRSIQTVLGTLSVPRNYYLKKCVGYYYPLDEIMGVDSYQRISNETSTELVNAAIFQSFEKASLAVTNGGVSKQTVMNKIRASHPVTEWPFEKRRVPVLHIDADEDHVHLQNGKPAIVPLATVYERIDKSTKRHYCVNAFSVGRYGLKADDFWEEIYNEVSKRYDIEDTAVYIHGDGATWIKKGTEWFPDAVFVLDPLHKNQALKSACANMRMEDCESFQNRMKLCLNSGDDAEFTVVRAEMCEMYPEQIENILKYTDYLLANIDGIAVRYYDKEAANGGATKPHISHGLSFRLSSRPMGWSRKTLEKFVPVLAAGKASLKKAVVLELPEVNEKIAGKSRALFKPNSIGLVNPDIAVSVPNSISGRQSSLYRFFKHIWG